jgi:pimeloyl-ACP methyl ester carboxylesterase
MAHNQSADEIHGPTEPADIGLGEVFRSCIVDTDGRRIRYVRGGSGPLVVLIHGWPQDWTAWRHVMPVLAETFTVVAVDLRGVGGSQATDGGYDAASLAQDVHAVIADCGLGAAYVAGHDIGGMVAFAHTRLHPDDVRGLMVLDVALPGLDPWQGVEASPLLWHFRFHASPNLPEMLVEGRQRAYIRDFIGRIALNATAISEADIARYAHAYGTRAQLRSGFEFYRAFPETAYFNETRTEPLHVPIVLAGGDHATRPANEIIAAALRAKGAQSVVVRTIENSGHFVVDEQPEQVIALIARHAAS